MTTFDAYARTILDRREFEGIRGIDHERNRYKTHIEGSALANMLLVDIRPKHIREWAREMGAKNAKGRDYLLATHTTKRSLSLISAIGTSAVEDELVEMDFTSGVKVKKRIDARSTLDKSTILTLEEQIAIAECKAIPVTDRLAIRFAIGTGLRQGEQFSLRLPNIITGHDEPHVAVRFGGKKDLAPKSGKIRRVILFGDSLVASKDWLPQLAEFAPENPLGLMFPTPRGWRRPVGKPLGAGYALKRNLAHVGITRRVRWHDLRHTFCSNLANGTLGTTWPLILVKEMAGHSSVTITERYVHASDRDMAKLGAASTFTHQSPWLAKTEPAEPFYAFDWPEAAAS